MGSCILQVVTPKFSTITNSDGSQPPSPSPHNDVAKNLGVSAGTVVGTVLISFPCFLIIRKKKKLQDKLKRKKNECLRDGSNYAEMEIKLNEMLSAVSLGNMNDARGLIDEIL